ALRRFPEHDPGSVSRCARHQRLFAGCARAGSDAVNDKWRKYFGDDLLRLRESCAALQRHGRSESEPRGIHSLSRLRFRVKEDPRELHLCRTGPNIGRAWHQWILPNVETLSVTRAVKAQLRSS